MTFEVTWKDLGRAIARENITLEKAIDQANADYKKAIAPFRKAVREAAAKEGIRFWEGGRMKEAEG